MRSFSVDQLLLKVKAQKWFYKFGLPDGSVTDVYIPDEVTKIHTTREIALREHLEDFAHKYKTALDISCHEGYFSFVLSEHISAITGVDKNSDTLTKARQMADLLQNNRVNFMNAPVEDLNDNQTSDFVLCFGLVYHIENPVEVFRKVSALTRKTLCVETQILPVELKGKIEDGSSHWQREIHGTFALCDDNSNSSEGGLTDLAVVPSRDAVVYMLKQFGFSEINFYVPKDNDYEQFTRGHRVIVFATKKDPV